MTGVNRLASGGLVDRNRELEFRFNGRSLLGLEGDSLASALLANGIRLTARSFKYHRPRGIVSCDRSEPGTLVEFAGDDGCGSLPATAVSLKGGMDARAVNCRPSASFDLGGINQLLAPLLPAGFYYKTFMWPNWKVYEPVIRRMAGLARAPAVPPPSGRFADRNHHCDALVVGGGPAGLAAASEVARSGADVVLVDRNMRLGGCLNSRRAEIEGMPSGEWALQTAASLSRMENVFVLQDAEAWAVRTSNQVMVCERSPADEGVIERSWRIRPRLLICAAGGDERMLVFPNNDRPGVMLASAIQTYINRYAVRPGRKAVLFANNDSAYEAARDMREAGIEVLAIVDPRSKVSDHACRDLEGIRLLKGHQVVDVRGRRGVRRVEVESLAGDGRLRFECDLLGVSGGWDPSVRLWSQAGGATKYRNDICSFGPEGKVDGVFCAGGSDGVFSAASAVAAGRTTGRAAAAVLGRASTELETGSGLETGYSIEPYWQAKRPRKAGSSFVDIVNDVTLADIHLALREGFSSIEQVKRYTTAGMGFNQGRTVGPNVAGIVAETAGSQVGEIGLTTFRSPTTPVSFGSIAGGRQGPAILPYRHTPITDWNIERGAVMYEAGARWRRPGYYPEPGESMQDAINRESEAVRFGVGVYDGSPLGTFAIKGPDALQLLNMLFAGDVSRVAAGSAQYGIMLTDDGRILDDGVVMRTGEFEYLLSMSTGNAPLVYRHISKFLSVDRPNWRVRFSDLTCQWMNATICGPGSRDLLTKLGTDIDISPKAFPFMTFRNGTVAGIPARVVRVSFTGSLSFEINTRPRDLRRLWDVVMRVGEPMGIAPVGSEANHVLRVEKGFISLGHEVDGTADPHDLGLGWLMSKTKGDFLGRRSVQLRRGSGRTRRELVGLLTEDPSRLIPEGAPLTPGGQRCASEGFVSASVWSVVNRRSIALALLENGRSRHGDTAVVRLPSETIQAKVCEPCFFDRDGKELRS